MIEIKSPLLNNICSLPHDIVLVLFWLSFSSANFSSAEFERDFTAKNVGNDGEREDTVHTLTIHLQIVKKDFGFVNDAIEFKFSGFVKVR